MSFASVKIGLISVSDRASTGVYEDKGIPALQAWLTGAVHNPITFATRLIADEQPVIESALIELCDIERCDLAGGKRDRVLQRAGEPVVKCRNAFVLINAAQSRCA